MKNVKFIYNPFSGENAILDSLDDIIEVHQQYGYGVIPFRLSKGVSVREAFKNKDEQYEYILVAGGDGTVDSVVNAMHQENIDVPLGILPIGTANDFAKHLSLPNNVREACVKILESKPVGVDLGMVNEKFFVNVASTGLFTDVSQKTDINMKNTLGKLAYYIKGLEELPNFRNLKIKITSDEITYNGEMYLLLVFNGKTAGNFRLATRASSFDGMLDVILFKPVPVRELIPIFIKVLRGEHLDSDKVLYFKTRELIVESDEDISTDIDGEVGPDFPLHIKCIKGGLKVLGFGGSQK